MSEPYLLGPLWAYAIEEDPPAPADGAFMTTAGVPTTPARSSHSRALENFTTEALAWAVRRDPRPLLEALAQQGIGRRPLAVQVAVETQAPLPGRGSRHLDTVVRVRSQDGSYFHVWLENKVHAQVSRDQLEVYRTALDAEVHRDHVARFLVWLGPEDPPVDQKPYLHKWIRWQSLADAARRLVADWFWADLVAFLEENGMTEQQTYPVSAREASALEDAQRLFLKVHVVLRAVNQWANETITEWPSDHWWKPGQVKGAILDSLLTSGEMLLVDGSVHPAYLEYGASSRGGEAWFVVRVVRKSRRDLAISSRVLEELEPTLGDWERPGGSRVILEQAVRAVTIERQEDAERWFRVRLMELRDARFFELAKSL